jgi:hypothetical protein
MNLPRGSGFALGALGATSIILLLGAAQAAGTVKLVLSGPVEIAGYPRAQDMRRIVEGTPFVVPAGKLFVVTGMGSNGHNFAPGPAPNKHVRVSFDGVSVLEAMILEWQGGGSYSGGGPSIPEVPPGLTAPAGTTITATDDAVDLGIVLGYLVNA